MSDELDLGHCCGCQRRGRLVRNMVMLDKKSPTPGRGWGCVACHLPSDGAMAVLCDVCAYRVESGTPLETVLRFAWKGYCTDGLVPIGELSGTHEHDMAYHPEVL